MPTKHGGRFAKNVVTAPRRSVRRSTGFPWQLQRSLERVPRAAPAARTDLPPEVLALAPMLGVPDNGGGRLVRLTRSGEM